MSALRRRTRRAARRTLVIKPIRDLQARINVTPLIDVVLVLLIIFMVVTPLVERDLSVQLASEQRSEAARELAPDQVLVAVGPSGSLSVNERPVPSGEYIDTLRGLLDGRAPEDQVVFVIAGDDTSFADLVQAIDRAKQAGATAIGLAADAIP